MTHRKPPVPAIDLDAASDATLHSVANLPMLPHAVRRYALARLWMAGWDPSVRHQALAPQRADVPDAWRWW